ncbi:MAG: hypothetical protein N4A50_04325 [Vallitalea sp.]|jgi:hypothetical protein|nr:hypothetical protein [Vallitalea sp.]
MRYNKKQRCLLAVTFVIIIFLLCSCQSSTDIKLDLEELHNENGEYLFPNTEWGMSVEEVEKSLGYDFGEPIVGSEPQPFDYRKNTEYAGAVFSPHDVNIKLLDSYADISFQFKSNELISVTLKINNGNLEKINKDIFDELTRIYGEETFRKDVDFEYNGSTIKGTDIYWENTDTQTNYIVLSSHLENSFVELVVSYIELDK